MTRLRTLLSVLFSLPLITSLARAADLTITVSNAHSSAGSVFVVLYDDSDASFMKPTLAEAKPENTRWRAITTMTTAGSSTTTHWVFRPKAFDLPMTHRRLPVRRSSPKQRLNLTARPAR
jgi:hypothetical protein